MDDVYIVVLDSAGYAGSVTIVDRECAAETAKQLRSGNRKVRQFSNRDEYLEFLDRDADERWRNKRLMRNTLLLDS